MKRYLSPVESLLLEHLTTRVVGVYTVRGQVDENLLAKAFEATLAVHPTLRSRVAEDEKGYFLHLCEAPRLQVRMGGADSLQEEFNTPLPPGGELARATLLRGADESTVVLNLHHAVSDGMSSIALGDALWSAYAELAAGRHPGLAANHVDRYPEPIEARLRGISDADVARFTAEQNALSKQVAPATLARTNGATGPDRAPLAEIQRLRLDRGDTERLRAAAKAAGVSVHALVSGVLLARLRTYFVPATGRVNLGCMSAVDLRSRLNPPLTPDRMIVAASWFTGVVEVAEDADPVELGLSYLRQLRAGIDNRAPELALRAVPHVSAKDSTLKANLSVSNLKTIARPTMPPGLDLTDVRILGIPDRNFEKPGTGRLRVWASTFDGRFSLDLAHDPRSFGADHVAELLDATGAALRSFSPHPVTP